MNSIPAQGDATKADVLSGKAFTSATYGADMQTGTMPNQGQKILTVSTVNQAIAKGYHNGLGYVKGEPNIQPGNIREGVTVGDVVGNYAGDINSLNTHIASVWREENSSRLLYTYSNFNFYPIAVRVGGQIYHDSRNSSRTVHFDVVVLIGSFNMGGDIINVSGVSGSGVSLSAEISLNSYNGGSVIVDINGNSNVDVILLDTLEILGI